MQVDEKREKEHFEEMRRLEEIHYNNVDTMSIKDIFCIVLLFIISLIVINLIF